MVLTARFSGGEGTPLYRQRCTVLVMGWDGTGRGSTALRYPSNDRATPAVVSINSTRRRPREMAE